MENWGTNDVLHNKLSISMNIFDMGVKYIEKHMCNSVYMVVVHSTACHLLNADTFQLIWTELNKNTQSITLTQTHINFVPHSHVCCSILCMLCIVCIQFDFYFAQHFGMENAMFNTNK